MNSTHFFTGKCEGIPDESTSRICTIFIMLSIGRVLSEHVEPPQKDASRTSIASAFPKKKLSAAQERINRLNLVKYICRYAPA